MKMTNVISFTKAKAINALTVDRTDYTREDHIRDLFAFDFAGVHTLCMGHPEWKETILTYYINVGAISTGIIVAQQVREDERAVKALLRIFNKCIKEKEELFALRDIPPYALGYAWCPDNRMNALCSLYARGNFQR